MESEQAVASESADQSGEEMAGRVSCLVSVLAAECDRRPFVQTRMEFCALPYTLVWLDQAEHIQRGMWETNLNSRV